MIDPAEFVTPPRRRAGLVILLAGFILAAAQTGCDTNPNADKETTIDFTTTPGNATVSIDGDALSKTTPTSAVLSKFRETHVTIAKPGFVITDLYVRPHDGDLQPNPVDVKLRPELLPETRGPDPQGDLARSLDILKQYVASGRILPEDQAYIEAQLRAFYLAPPAAK
jgi:hypothetical protein